MEMGCKNLPLVEAKTDKKFRNMRNRNVYVPQIKALVYTKIFCLAVHAIHIRLECVFLPALCNLRGKIANSVAVAGPTKRHVSISFNLLLLIRKISSHKPIGRPGFYNRGRLQ